MKKYIPKVVTRHGARVLLKTQKNSPQLLFAAGIVTAVASTVVACRATLRLEEILDDHKGYVDAIEKTTGYNSDNERNRDKALLIGHTTGRVMKLYAPAVGLGVTSVACLTSSHHILTKRNAGLTAAYAAASEALEKYRARVIADQGEEKDREYLVGTVETTETETTAKGKTKEVVKKSADPQGHSIYAKFFDENCAPWSPRQSSNYMFLLAQQRYANDRLVTYGHVFLNEVYESLGLPRTPAGAVAGWVLDKNNPNYIDFGIFDENDERKRAFVNGDETNILLDFNVDGIIFDKI